MQLFALNFLNGRWLRETRCLKIFDLTQLNWRIRFASIQMMWKYQQRKFKSNLSIRILCSTVFISSCVTLTASNFSKWPIPTYKHGFKLSLSSCMSIRSPSREVPSSGALMSIKARNVIESLWTIVNWYNFKRQWIAQIREITTENDWNNGYKSIYKTYF